MVRLVIIVFTRAKEHECLPKDGNLLSLSKPVMFYDDCKVNWDEISSFKGFIFTSQYAVDLFLKNTSVDNAVFYCVGAATANSLFPKQNVYVPFPNNAESLIQYILKHHDQQFPLCYLSAFDVSTPIDKRLCNAGIQCERRIIYESKKQVQDFSFITNNDCISFVFYSKKNYQFFIENIKEQGLLDSLKSHTALFVLPTRSREYVFSLLDKIKWKKFKNFQSTQELHQYLKEAIK